jgi:hypothetical protein
MVIVGSTADLTKRYIADSAPGSIQKSWVVADASNMSSGADLRRINFGSP